MTCDIDAERRHWTFTQGDEWHRSWSRTSGDRSYDNASLLVQIRAGDTKAATLVASSDSGDVEGSVVAVDISGSDLEAATPLFDWSVADTAGIDPDVPLWFQAECEIDGRLTTFLTHRMWVEPEIATPTEVGS